jgi:hypothetical protein
VEGAEIKTLSTNLWDGAMPVKRIDYRILEEEENMLKQGSELFKEIIDPQTMLTRLFIVDL